MYWIAEARFDRADDYAATINTDDARSSPRGGGKARTEGGGSGLAPPRFNCTACPAGRFSNRTGIYYDSCLPCNNGTYSDDPDGAVECKLCAKGSYAPNRGSNACEGCPPGRFTNHTGEGSACIQCSIGKSTNNVSGLTECIRCSTWNTPARPKFIINSVTECLDQMQCGQKGGFFYYQDAPGSATCKECDNSGEIGSYGCNELDGSFQCYGLFQVDDNCRSFKRILEGFIGAVLTFMVVVFVIFPLVFTTGSLSLLSRQWRNDLLVVLEWMRSATNKAAVASKAEALLFRAKMREENIRECFRLCCDNESKIATVEDIGPMLESIGLTRDQFLPHVRGVLGLHEFKYAEFRRLLSFFAQRLEYGHLHARAVAAYRAAEDRHHLKRFENTSENIVETALGILNLRLTQVELEVLTSASRLKFRRGAKQWPKVVGGAPHAFETDADADADGGDDSGYSSDEPEEGGEFEQRYDEAGYDSSYGSDSESSYYVDLLKGRELDEYEIDDDYGEGPSQAATPGHDKGDEGSRSNAQQGEVMSNAPINDGDPGGRPPNGDDRDGGGDDNDDDNDDDDDSDYFKIEELSNHDEERHSPFDEEDNGEESPNPYSSDESSEPSVVNDRGEDNAQSMATEDGRSANINENVLDNERVAKPSSSRDGNARNKASFDDHVNRRFICSITQELMVDPVVADDGSIYERSAIEGWLSTHNTSPLDPSCELAVSRLMSVRLVKNQIEELVESNQVDDGLLAAYLHRKERLALERARKGTDAGIYNTSYGGDDDTDDFDTDDDEGYDDDDFYDEEDDKDEEVEDNYDGDGDNRIDEDNNNSDLVVDDLTLPPLGPSLPKPKEAFHDEGFAAALYRLEKNRLEDELMASRQDYEQEISEAFHSQASLRGNMLVLDSDAAFRRACRSMNLIWDLDVLDSVANPDRQRRFTRKLLRWLESGTTYLLVLILIVSEVLFNLNAVWLAALLVSEFGLRATCYYRLQTHTLGHFLRARNHRNDLVATAADVGFVIASMYLDSEGRKRPDVLVNAARFTRVAFRAAPIWFPCIRFCFRFFCGICLRCGWFWGRPRRESTADEADTMGDGPGQFMVTYLSFRRYVAAFASSNANVWPASEYREAFYAFDRYHGVTVAISNLPGLLADLGIVCSDSELKSMERLCESSLAVYLDGSKYFFFDSFVQAVTFVRDDKVESERLDGLVSRRHQAKRALVTIRNRTIMTAAVGLTEIIESVITLLVDLFILASGMYGKDAVGAKASEVARNFGAVFQSIPGIQAAIFTCVSAVFNAMYEVSAAVTVDLQIEDSVTCSGSNAMLVLPIILMVTAVIVLIFDSSIFSFLEVAKDDYAHNVSLYVHCVVKDAANARFIEGALVHVVLGVLSGVLVNITTITIASMLIREYIPYWSAIQLACEVSFMQHCV